MDFSRRTASSHCRGRAVRATLIVAASAMMLAGTASCGSSERERAIQTIGPIVLTALPTWEAAAKTRVAEEWPVFNGVPTVTYTVDGDTRTFTGGHCRATPDRSKIVVISGDESWVAAPQVHGEGIELRADWPFDVDGFWIDVALGDQTYHTSYEQVESLDDRYTALALSPDQRSGTFRGKGWSVQDGTQIWVTISGSFVCNADATAPSPTLAPALTPEPSPPPAGTPPGAQTITMEDLFFADADGDKDPTIRMPAGESLTFDLINNGAAIHSLHVADASGRYATALCTTGGSDPCSDPPAVRPGSTATITVKFDAPGTYEFRCDFHPAEMTGRFVAQ